MPGGGGRDILRAVFALAIVFVPMLMLINNLGRGAVTSDWMGTDSMMKPLIDEFSRPQFSIYNASHTKGASSSWAATSVTSMQGSVNQIISDIAHGGSQAIELAASHIQRLPASIQGMGSATAAVAGIGDGGGGGGGTGYAPEDVVDDIWEVPSKIGSFREGLVAKIPLSEAASPSQVLSRLRRRAYAR
jgi:hypothetical protein